MANTSTFSDSSASGVKQSVQNYSYHKEKIWRGNRWNILCQLPPCFRLGWFTESSRCCSSAQKWQKQPHQQQLVWESTRTKPALIVLISRENVSYYTSNNDAGHNSECICTFSSLNCSCTTLNIILQIMLHCIKNKKSDFQNCKSTVFPLRNFMFDLMCYLLFLCSPLWKLLTICV